MHAITQRRLRLAAALATAMLAGACASAPAGSSAVAPATIAASPAATAAPSASVTPVATPTSGPTTAPSVAPATAELTVQWTGRGPSQSAPGTWGPAVDPTTGNLWVSNGHDNEFWIFSADGTYLESWGSAGTGPGQFRFSDPSNTEAGFGTIAFTADGGFLVADTGNSRIQAFDHERRFVREWGTFGAGDGQFGQVLAVVTDGSTVYVGDGERNDIQAFDMSGTFLRSFGGFGGRGTFLALDPAGNIYATNPNGGPPTITKFDPSGSEVARYDVSFAGSIPAGVAVGPNGHMFVTANKNDHPDAVSGTWELGPDGTPLRGWTTAAETIALSPTGDVLYLASQWGGALSWDHVAAYTLP